MGTECALPREKHPNVPSPEKDIRGRVLGPKVHHHIAIYQTVKWNLARMA